MNQYDPMFDLNINVGHCDLYSMVRWFCVISWRLFDVWTVLFGIMSQYDPKFYLKINIGHYDLYFMVKWFCLISWRLGRTWLNLVTWTCGSLSEGQHDLYFTVQWFCLISWRLFGRRNQYDQTFRALALVFCKQIRIWSVCPSRIIHALLHLTFQDSQRHVLHLSRLMTKPTKQHVRQANNPPSLIRDFAVRMKKVLSYSSHWAHSEDSDQTGRMPRLIWVFAGRTVILLV